MKRVTGTKHAPRHVFTNALARREAAYVRVDVWVYIAAALLLVIIAPFRSRWRILVGGWQDAAWAATC